MAPPQDEMRWRTAGDRIETLLDATATGGPVARQRAEQLVRELTDLYGAGLERLMAVACTRHPELADAFAADDLVASLLLVHGLHPHNLRRRVADALDTVRPYLGSHGGDVELLEVTDDQTVRLRFTGSCRGCPSSAVTLELAVEDAVRAAAPEIVAIEVVAAQPEPVNAVIPAEALLGRIHADGHRRAEWQPVPELGDLAPGEVGGFLIAGTAVLACRVADPDAGESGAAVYAYHDRCGACTASLAGAALRGRVLRCPQCRAGFDIVHAGAGVDGADHLEPIPLLVRDGVLSMAIPESVPG